MSVFGEQLKKRSKSNKRAVKESEQIIGGVISGRKKFYNYAYLSSENDLRQIQLIANYYKLDIPDDSKIVGDLDERISAVIRPSCAEKRVVRLEGDWWKDSDGPLLVSLKEDNSLLSIFPGSFGGYYYVDFRTGRKIIINSKVASAFNDMAYCFYRPLPNVSMTGKDFLMYLIKQMRISDVFLYVFTALVVTFIGMLTPIATNIVFSEIIPTNRINLLLSMFIMLLATALGSYLIRSVRFAINLRIQNRLDVISSNAVYSRILNLPVSFFSDKTAGNLARKASSLNKMSKIIGDMLMMITNVIISFVSALPIIFIAPKLSLPVISTIVLMLVVFLISILQEMNLVRGEIVWGSENSGLVYGLVSGVQRIKISGKEDRAYAKWLRVYAKKANSTYQPLFPLCVRSELITVIKLAGLLWAFFISYNNNVTVGQLAAFSSAYAIAVSCIDTIVSHGRNIARIKPILETGEEILKVLPEQSLNKREIRYLKGEVNLSHVTFRYGKDEPAILNDLSLNIKQGEYVAIVGKSGCGKSTLAKLLLGFIKPQRGSISYDNIEMEQLDLRSLRRRIGVVLQDGKLFPGDIYSNIVLTSPRLNEEEAWEAAEKAAIADDIRKMPQGMHTVISEGSAGLSGGQKQRIMIARAIAAKPGLLIFDEATSALDNLTQQHITESLNEMKCTRIIIAHRLSTIRNCDSIVVMNDGKIEEKGTYDELIAKNGFFAELVARQQL